MKSRCLGVSLQRCQAWGRSLSIFACEASGLSSKQAILEASRKQEHDYEELSHAFMIVLDWGFEKSFEKLVRKGKMAHACCLGFSLKPTWLLLGDGHSFELLEYATLSFFKLSRAGMVRV